MSKPNRKKQALPTKKTLNLMQIERRANHPGRIVLMIGVLAMLLFGVVKFGVFDRMYALYTANSEAARAESALEDARKGTEHYEDILKEYQRYTFSGFTDAEMERVDRGGIVELVDELLLDVGYAKSYVISDNTLTLVLHSVTLAETSVLIEDLYSDPSVHAVAITTAGSDPARDETVNIQVRFKKVGVQP
ncbi:MAG TPA: hypothetical protein DF480_00260 [Clostridiales bacterium]|nr:hypothetical protein [Clostridiales bacterium]